MHKIDPAGIFHSCVNLLLKSTMRIEKRGMANIPKDGKFTVAASHRTYIDPFIINVALRVPVRWIGASFLEDIPVIRTFSRMAGTIIVSTIGKTTLRSIGEIFIKSREKQIGIFPEGYTPLVDMMPALPLRPFHRGFAYIAGKIDKPVLPVTILPIREKIVSYPLPITIRKMFIPHTDLCELQARIVYRHVRIIIHPPVTPPPETATRAQLKEFSDLVSTIISGPLIEQKNGSTS